MKSMRLQRGLSQLALGRKLGLDPGVASTRINRYEVGVHDPDLATAQQIAQALGVPLAYLFAADKKLARAILAFDQLSAKEKDAFLAALEGKHA
ncbi:helix-turn-helix transcriptional regulator [Luteibacter sp. 3190]|uniref:helix-turn-helix transcriptional regulator n=1 Tax=Luteibacter sp. 3190 TaxID=2817736 RepID=UPI002854E8D7|nr:helix-turn-helix transcriptional regulator [Luteibacter sp. 3190]MDR6935735.1 transcriptional regulator with XRE-family HTH domain [Luteibacter sp. 3190]